MGRRSPTAVGCAALAALALASPARAVDPREWMAGIDPGTLISDLSIPGTHDSGALYDAPLPGTAKAQTLTIPEQLDVGVRFIDARFHIVHPGEQDKYLQVHHGPIDQQMGAIDLVLSCLTFLEAHPTETIVMSVKEEYGKHPYQFEQMVHDLIRDFSSPPDYVPFFTEPRVPSLGEVRGRIVLVRRFPHNDPRPAEQVEGIDAASTWQDNQVFQAGSLDVEDVYEYYCTDYGENHCASAVPVKWQYVQDHLLRAARGARGNQLLYITFTSATVYLGRGFPENKAPAPMAILLFAQPIDRDLADFVAGVRDRFGIVAMDYVDDNLGERIFSTNF